MIGPIVVAVATFVIVFVFLIAEVPAASHENALTGTALLAAGAGVAAGVLFDAFLKAP